MAPESHIMNDFMSIIESIFDNKPYECVGSDVFYVEDPFSEQAFVPPL